MEERRLNHKELTNLGMEGLRMNKKIFVGVTDANERLEEQGLASKNLIDLPLSQWPSRIKNMFMSSLKYYSLMGVAGYLTMPITLPFAVFSMFVYTVFYKLAYGGIKMMASPFYKLLKLFTALFVLGNISFMLFEPEIFNTENPMGNVKQVFSTRFDNGWTHVRDDFYDIVKFKKPVKETLMLLPKYSKKTTTIVVSDIVDNINPERALYGYKSLFKALYNAGYLYDAVQSAQYTYTYNLQYTPCKLNPVNSLRYGCIKPLKPVLFKDIDAEIVKINKKKNELLENKKKYNLCVSKSTITTLGCGNDPGNFDPVILDHYEKVIKSNKYYGKYFYSSAINFFKELG